MSSTYVLSNVPLLLGSVQLGSLVPDIRQPHQDAFTAITVSENTDFLVHNLQNFDGTLEDLQGKSFFLNVTKLSKVSHESIRSSGLHISAKRGKSYELKQPRELFRRICKLDSARNWLQEGIEEGQKSYFVVGVRTYITAEATTDVGQSSRTTGEIQIPAGDIMSGGAAAGHPQSSLLDLGSKVDYQKSSTASSSYHTTGEYIYAICFRRVVFRRFKKNSVDNASLKAGNCWIPVVKRSQDDNDPDVIEAVIEDVAFSDEGSFDFVSVGNVEEQLIQFVD